MPIKNKKLTKTIEQTKLPYEETNDIKKLMMFVTIVNHGQASAIMKLFEGFGCSLQFIQMGTGTAKKEILDILGVSDNKKDVVFSLVRKEVVPELKKEIEAFFLINKRNRGVGFTIPLTSVAGVKAYQFLSDCL